MRESEREREREREQVDRDKWYSLNEVTPGVNCLSVGIGLPQSRLLLSRNSNADLVRKTTARIHRME